MLVRHERVRVTAGWGPMAIVQHSALELMNRTILPARKRQSADDQQLGGGRVIAYHAVAQEPPRRFASFQKVCYMAEVVAVA